MTTRAHPPSDDPAGMVRLELARGATLIELVRIFGEQLEIVGEEPPVAEVPEARLIRQLNRSWEKRRTQFVPRVLIAAVSLAVAVWVGYLFGSGIFNPQDRYNAQRGVAQQGEVMLYGPPEVYGHPGTETTVEWQDLVRQFKALDQMK